MAVEAATGAVVEHILNEALSLAAEEVSLIFRFKDDLKGLTGELEIIQALLADADGKDIRPEAMQRWLKSLKVAASDAEDFLEDYKYELLRRKVNTSRLIPQKKWDKVRGLFSPFSKLAFRVKMAQKIKDVSSQLKGVSEQGRNYGLDASEFLNRSFEIRMDRVPTSPSIQEKDFVGRDEDVKKVVDMLINAKNEKHFAVVGIVGMGGQGKTTLAQLVCKHDEVMNHFEKFIIWVCVSNDFKVERILNEMVESVTKQSINLTNRQALVEKLQETLRGKRYLLVLDDVWNEDQEKWESMEKDLQEIGGSSGTKVMVTTRSEKVASIMRVCQMHLLNKMSDPDSWALFKQRAFAEGGVVETPNFEDIGKRLVKRCNGLPLAIKTLGGMLYSKKEVHEWLSIEESDIWSLTDIYSEEGVLPSIRLSYNHLPTSSLKQCFTYCSLFPKDTNIYKDDVIVQWMAQGFLNPSKESPLHMEELGDNYFNVLLWNSLLQEPACDFKGRMYCKMHDIVHDFALLLSKDYCMTIRVGQNDKNIDKAVHLSLISYGSGMVDMSQGISEKLRTINLRGVIGNELIKFRYLRTLILHGPIEQLPSSIGKLKQLRYMDIEGTCIRELPATYVNFYNLQTLRVQLEHWSIIYLGSLLNLRHITLGSAGECMLVGIRQLTHLQTLPYFIVGDNKGCKIEELGPLNNLKGRLLILGLNKVKNREEAQKASLSQKTKVDHLVLMWDYRRDRRRERESSFNSDDVIEGLKPHPYLKTLAIWRFRGSRFPSWMTHKQLKNLVELELYFCDSCEHFPVLGCLPTLRSLIIECCSELATLPSWEGLPSLEKLSILGCHALEGVENVLNGLECLPNLKDLTIGFFSEEIDYFPWPNNNSTENGKNVAPHLYFPCLKKLNLYGWRKITSLPEQLQHLPSLTSLTISRFEELEALPEWLGNIQSLEFLELYRCLKLKFLPSVEAMQCLINLQVLTITFCPHLEERCTEGSGPDWHKIAHIPEVHIPQVRCEIYSKGGDVQDEDEEAKDEDDDEDVKDEDEEGDLEDDN